MYRHHPQTALVMDIVDSGQLGQILGIHSSFHFRLDQSVNIRLDPVHAGGSLWDVGVYPLSYSQMVMGEPPQQVTGWQRTGPSGVDLTFFAQMTYTQGRVAQFTCSFDSPFHAAAEIIGSQGRLLVTRPFSALDEGQLILYRQDGSSENIAVPSKELYLGEIEDMENCALNGASQRVTLAQTRDHIRTALALYQSAREGSTVSLE
jgi:predicted dehydrogenase